MELRQEALPGDDSTNAALYGPLVLAADLGAGPADGPDRIIHSGDTVPKNLAAPAALPKLATPADTPASEWIEKASTSELHFRVSGEGKSYSLMPMYQIADQRYSVYWQLQKASPKLR